MADETTQTVIVAVLEDHIWTPRKKGPAECWSANDRECGERFTTGGEYRRHVAALIAERLALSPERSSDE